MIFLGVDGDTPYVISALGSVVDSKGEDVILVNSVALNSLEVKRRNGTTWLENITHAVVFYGNSDEDK